MTAKHTKTRPLTAKQQRFVDAYDGNATEAARKAGYAGNDRTLQAVGSENLSKPMIARAIAARENKRAKATIATREERQAWWTAVMRGEYSDVGDDGQVRGADWKDRLRAAELLGKSQADFIDIKRHQDADGGTLGDRLALTDEELMRKAAGQELTGHA